MLVHRRVTFGIKVARTHLYTIMERGIVRVRCFAQEHKKISHKRLEPGPLDRESSVPTMRPPRLQTKKILRINPLRAYMTTEGWSKINPFKTRTCFSANVPQVCTVESVRQLHYCLVICSKRKKKRNKKLITSAQENSGLIDHIRILGIKLALPFNWG